MLPSYNPPSVDRMRDTLIPRLEEKIDRKLRSELDGINAAAGIIDLWGSPSMDSEIGISLSYATKDFKPRTVLLACNQMKGSHTAANIHGEFDGVAQKYNIKNKVHYSLLINPSISFFPN